MTLMQLIYADFLFNFVMKISRISVPIFYENRVLFIELILNMFGFYSRLTPVISAGFSMPMSAKMVGAMSANLPLLMGFW